MTQPDHQDATQILEKRSASERAQKHAELLEAALARPGVREVMKVYGDWQEKDRALDVYRSATRKPERIRTTNSSQRIAW